MGPWGDGCATGRGREGHGRAPGLAAAKRLPSVELLAAGLGLASDCSAAQPPSPANDAAGGIADDVRDVDGPDSGWRSWFGAAVRETLDSTGTFRS